MLGARAVGAVPSTSARYGQASQSSVSPPVELRPRGEVSVLRALRWFCVRCFSAVSMAEEGTELSPWGCPEEVSEYLLEKLFPASRELGLLLCGVEGFPW